MSRMIKEAGVFYTMGLDRGGLAETCSLSAECVSCLIQLSNCRLTVEARGFASHSICFGGGLI